MLPFLKKKKTLVIIPAGLNFYFEAKDPFSNLLDIDDDGFFVCLFVLICGHHSGLLVSQCEQRDCLNVK